MKIFIILFLLTNVAMAGILDFVDLKQAKTAYLAKDYKKSQNLYQAFDNDFAKLNTANTLYKQGKYQQALDKYQTIQDKSLAFDKSYNSGNTYAKLHKIDKAIKSYEDALKLKNDTDAKYNLELLKKQKKEQKKKKQSNKNNKAKNKDGKQKEQKKKKQSNKNNKAKNKDGKQKEQKKKKQSNKNNKAKNKDGKQKAGLNKEQFKPSKESGSKAEKKWKKILNNRGIKTLMLPLNNKNQQNDKNTTHPW